MNENQNNWTYQCPTCIHNHNTHNDWISVHEACPKGHCVLCVWQKERICNDYEFGEAVEIDED